MSNEINFDAHYTDHMHEYTHIYIAMVLHPIFLGFVMSTCVCCVVHVYCDWVHAL